jgi:hypothetical protein
MFFINETKILNLADIFKKDFKLEQSIRYQINFHKCVCFLFNV